ncbi:hypothetical protein ASPVEDRAFT_33612 [Aspergillus versicolor CBS 583.65]|uniref:Uncharacterized protein n=1 Tax=Aspergillus versicolor CBS 583.65 TaxID=1036611 RepID=A0A1L9Q0Z1_ASPVE|nr:uncharacterized protein ASPVEDRAFT_33612 [Aspergillus versicolor CBS 583.65]OJJ07389.1 hypothetical protein ASPVEDRAFT_33612 [Aspergillus versicolor CBS 583.65]
MPECTCDCEYELYFGITRSKSNESGTRWIIILLDPKNEVCNWYQSVTGQNGYTATVAPGLTLGFNEGFRNKVRIGTIRKRDMNIFQRIFAATEPQDSHRFAAEFVLNLSRESLVEGVLGWDMLRAAKNTAYIWEHLNIRPSVHWQSLADREDSCIFETASRNSYVVR